jgi:hypothetical protein
MRFLPIDDAPGCFGFPSAGKTVNGVVPLSYSIVARSK